MNHINTYRQSYSLTILSLFLIISLSACGVSPVKQEKISSAESCNKLKEIIADHPNKFNRYKKIYISHRKYGSWTADKILPSAKQCHVWEWFNGLTSYACEWKVEKGEAQALANFEKASKVIENCLGNAWTAKTNTTQSGGKHTVYSNANTPTVISIRYFEDSAGWEWLHSWHNTVSLVIKVV